MRISFKAALLLACISGYLALVYELLWARVYAFVTASRPVALGTMLGSYLLGLAIGSLWSRRWQRSDTGTTNDLRSLARLIVVSNVAAFLVVPAISWCVVHVHWAVTLPLVTIGAMLLGTQLPLLCHLAIDPDERAGKRMSQIYLSNIIGSGLGSLLTGFLLMDWLPLWQIAAVQLALAVLIAITIGRHSIPTPLDYSLWALAGAIAVCSPFLHDGLYERLQLRREYDAASRFIQIKETRHSVITVDREKKIYGGGIYDGVIDVRPKYGGGLSRPFFIGAVHSEPREMLIIGLSGGAWAQVLAHHPHVRHVTIVEIDAGYLDIIRSYPEVSSLLTNPKVRIVIDDGRRWLRRNAGRSFDVIVMNTSYNWREYSSALLGMEFLELARSHLAPGGVLMWNCTGSDRAIRTGMAVFPYTLMYSNQCVGSNDPIKVDSALWRATLAVYKIDGRPVFDLTTAAGRQELDEMVATSDSTGPATFITPPHSMGVLYGPAKIITDDNLGNEYAFSYADHSFFRRFSKE